MRNIWNILGYLLQLLFLVSFFYGVYCALQGWTRRIPKGTRHQSAMPTLEDFTPQGRLFLKQMVQAWAVAIGAMLLVALVF